MVTQSRTDERRFILVQCVRDAAAIDFGMPQWRATSATVASAVDLFFFAEDVARAKQHVRRMFPGASFSDEMASTVLGGG